MLRGESAFDTIEYVLPKAPLGKKFDKWLLKTAIGTGAGEMVGDDATIHLGEVQRNLDVYATYKEVLGYFKQIGTTAYYYPSEEALDEEKVAITSSNMGKYLGREVKYLPENAETNTTGYGTSTTYRLFYVDVDEGINSSGKYGDGKGTIYLKADCNSEYLNLMSSNLITSYDSGTRGDSSDNREIMFKLNPAMNGNRMDNIHDCCVAWMLDPDLWLDWKDESIKLDNDNSINGVRYVVGGPSLEMFIDSYNNYLDAHTQNNIVDIYKSGSYTERAEKMECEYVTSGYNFEGYIIGFKSTPKSSFNYSLNQNSLFGYNSTNGQQMYNPPYNTKYWLGSPSAIRGAAVNCVYGGYLNNVSCADYTGLSICPLVSIKSGVSIFEKK